MNIDITDMTIDNLRINTTANLSDAPTVRCADIDVRPYRVRAILRRDDVDEQWRCTTVVLYGHEDGDTSRVPRIIPVEFSDPREDWSRAPEWVKELAGRLVAEVTP